MTRINLVSPKNLSNRHLLAEYREITRIPGNLKKSLSAKKPFVLTDIPDSYKLGVGHVKFFYNKMDFLKNRYKDIVKELENRGFMIQYRETSVFDSMVCIDQVKYQPTIEEININIKRLIERDTENFYKKGLDIHDIICNNVLRGQYYTEGTTLPPAGDQRVRDSREQG